MRNKTDHIKTYLEPAEREVVVVLCLMCNLADSNECVE